MKLREFVTKKQFGAGDYQALLPIEGGSVGHLITFVITSPDEEGSRNVPALAIPVDLEPQYLKIVLAAAVRAGVRHPGIRNEDLARLHRVAFKEGQVELFSDLNALTTGLLLHLVRSLGRRIARVVISSSSIDVLHEYQSRYVADARLGRAEMVRALRVLDEVRRTTPVHIHQLSPGTARYFLRGGAQPDGSEIREDREESLYISEDRQMMGAFWDYQTRSNPRLPVFLVTSDFNLAHVCAAERAPFVFARTPFEFWRKKKDAIQLEALWFDSFALAFRACLPHFLLWELSLVFGKVHVFRTSSGHNELSLSYDHRGQLPGQQEDVEVNFSPDSLPAPPISRSDTGPGPSRSIMRENAGDRKIKLSLGPIIEALPTREGQRIPLQAFRAHDEDSLRQFRQLGHATGLYKIDGSYIVAGESLTKFLSDLSGGDYLAVNETFRRYLAYDRVLSEARVSGRFPNSKIAGAATGWAVILGAGFKTRNGVIYGLSETSEYKFEEAVVRFHRELGDGQPAAPLPHIMEKVCLALRLSPIRFEVMLAHSLGRGALANYEMQRAAINFDLPKHQVIVFPTSALSESYLRLMEPGRGIVINGTLVSSLVRRSGRV
jgi:hypothetical protein